MGASFIKMGNRRRKPWLVGLLDANEKSNRRLSILLGFIAESAPEIAAMIVALHGYKGRLTVVTTDELASARRRWITQLWHDLDAVWASPQPVEFRTAAEPIDAYRLPFAFDLARRAMEGTVTLASLAGRIDIPQGVLEEKQRKAAAANEDAALRIYMRAIGMEDERSAA